MRSQLVAVGRSEVSVGRSEVSVVVSSCGVELWVYSCHFRHFSEIPALNSGLFDKFSLDEKQCPLWCH